MSASQFATTILEFLFIVAIIVGLMYEPVLAKWEQKQGERMLKAFKKMKECRK